MKNFLNQLPSKWKELTRFLQDKKTRRYSRITYGVVWNLLLLFIILTVLGFSFAGGIGAGYFAAMVKDEPVRSKEELKRDIYNYEETSEIYFGNNVYLGKLKTDLEREEVTLDKVSKHLANAVIATEDEYFYEHDGVVPKAIMRAVFQEMTNSALKSGGSTLTQQLIKNQVLTNEVSFDRKAKEILLALRVEKFFEKDEIIQTYLNVSTFGRNSSGQNIAGVQSASEGIFGKAAKDLNIPQSAFIAGLPQSPFGYTPYTQEGTIKKNLAPGLIRMKTVLKRMRDGNYISEKEYQDALKYDLKKDFIGKKASPIENYPWVTYEIEKRSIDILAKILAKKDGYDENDLKNDKDLREQYITRANRNLRQNGYKIHSTIDKKIYDQMQKVVKNYQYYGSAKPQEVKDPDTKKMKTVMEPVETGGVLIENKTGRIISFVGGRDHKREATNHATSATKPNGSTMKPLLVYAPGIELGKLSPGSVKANVPVRASLGSSKPWPSNYGGGGYTGLTTAREALAKSYNVPAVLFYLDIMNQQPIKYLEKMGFSSLNPRDYSARALALGGMTDGVTVEENVNAYATFANGGKFVDGYMIDKIETKDGKVIYQHKAKPENVFTPQTSYLTLDMMRDVISGGTASSLRSHLAFSADWAGKTGTTQNFQDAWFVATNPNVTFGTWIGYDTPKSLQQNYRGIPYSKRNIYLWAQLMNAAYKVQPELVAPKNRFEMPGGIVRRSFCAVSGLLPSDACSRAGMVQTDLFNAKFVPGKADGSFLGAGSYVQIGSRRYAALATTPSEFTSSGFSVSPSNFDQIGGRYIIDPGSLFPNYKSGGSTLSSNAVLNDNGKTPSPPSVSMLGNTIVWRNHPEGDVIGYRIYNKGKRVGSVKAGDKLAFSGGSGSYYVTAVDIAGKESAPSSAVSNSGEPKSAAPNTKPDVKPQDKPNPKNNPAPPATNPTDAPPPADPVPAVPNPNNGSGAG